MVTTREVSQAGSSRRRASTLRETAGGANRSSFIAATVKKVASTLRPAASPTR